MFLSDGLGMNMKWLADRIRQRVQVQIKKDKLKALHSGPLYQQQGTSDTNHQSQDLLSPTKKQANRRRELYDQLVHLRATTTRRVHTCETQFRSTRASQELLSVRLASSCENRLGLLQQQQELSSLLSSFDKATRTTYDPSQFYERIARFQAETQSWSAERQAQAWQIHAQCVQVVQSKRFWWQTTIAGAEKDIRKVYATSPWENDRKVWTWPPPRQEASTRTDDPTTSHVPGKPGLSHSSDVDTFIFSLNQSDNQVEDDDRREVHTKCLPPLDDHEASEWWRAHCMQTHLVLSEPENDQHASNNKFEAEDEFHDRHWSSEVLANPIFYRLHLQSQRQRRLKEHKLAVNTLTDRFQKHVNQRVGELEIQIEVNTKLQQDIVLRRQQIRKRRSREENSVVAIQRVFRGLRGRKLAQEVRAEFFVMVRGRAIRRGKCEECGEQPAVLECNECEESLHFCPLCWVQVHGTRRRRLHVAIPMSVPLKASRRGAIDSSLAPTISKASEPKSKTPNRAAQPVSEARQTGGAQVLGTGNQPRRKPQTLKANSAALTAKRVVSTVEKQPKATSEKAAEVVTPLAEDKGDNLFANHVENGGDGGDSSCEPVLEEDETLESEPRPSQMVISDANSETSKPTGNLAQQSRIARTTAASRATAPRPSLKQRREGSTKPTDERVDGEPSNTTRSSGAAASLAVEAPSAGNTGLGNGGLRADTVDSSPRDDAVVTIKPKKPALVPVKQELQADGWETQEIEPKPQTEADEIRQSANVKSEQVRKAAEPAKATSAARLSLKQRIESPPASLQSVESEEPALGDAIQTPTAAQDSTASGGTHESAGATLTPPTAELQQVALSHEETKSVVSSEPVSPQPSLGAAEEPKPSQAEEEKQDQDELETKALAPRQPTAEATLAPDETLGSSVVGTAAQPHEVKPESPPLSDTN